MYPYIQNINLAQKGSFNLAPLQPPPLHYKAGQLLIHTAERVN